MSLASGGVTVGAGLGCESCHDYTLSHIDHNFRSFDCGLAGNECDPNEYQQGFRLKLVEGWAPMV